MQTTTITEHLASRNGHDTFYLAAGPEDGPLLVFVHGWPELSLSWRHQLPVMAGLGFRCVAPDLRGYGRSSVYQRHLDYALEPIVGDMLALLQALGRQRAVWIGHDWGGPVVWSLAAHHPQSCAGVAALCAPYRTLELGLEAMLPLINRDIYPEHDYPAGQWEYMRYYEEHFEQATAAFERDPTRVLKLLLRKGKPAGFGQLCKTALVRREGGWFGGSEQALPDVPLDTDVLSEADLLVYAESLQRNSFFGPDSYYMNHQRNAAFAARASGDGVLSMPTLFLGARFDYTCETVTSRLAEPMRQHCSRLTEQLIDSGHWMAQQRPQEVNAALAAWLARALPDYWPTAGRS